jgi:serine O-acetyltransferase
MIESVHNDTLSELAARVRAAWQFDDRSADCGRVPDAGYVDQLVRLYTVICFPQLSCLLEPGRTGDRQPDAADRRNNFALDLLHERLASLLRGLLVRLNGWALLQPDRARPHLGRTEADRLAEEIASTLVRQLPSTMDLLHSDLDAALDGDPACRGREEVLICYPGFKAILVHRFAHQLYRAGSPLAARVLAEWVHGQTGIDIHPGAGIGHHFFIDHGTGVVIGETCRIGNHVRIYQGVTLGALNFPRDAAGQLIRDQRRHPTIGNHVAIFANASILGGETVIGDHCVIGSSVWLTESVPAGTRVVMEKPKLRIRGQLSAGDPDDLDFQI